MTKIILDTDIGDDIDDAFALGLVLASDEIELCGVTTVFQNSIARTRQARTILKVANREDIPVAAGCGTMLSSRFNYNINPRKSYLDREPPCQMESCLPEEELVPIDSRHGVDFIIDTIMHGDGDIEIVTIGALTNVAMAVTKQPEIIEKIPRITCMGGIFEDQNREGIIDWNMLCDPFAADILVNSGIQMDFVGLDVTKNVPLLKDDIQRLRNSGKPLAKKMNEALTLWLEKVNARNGVPLMHDPLTIAVLIDPELVSWRRGLVEIEVTCDTVSHYTKFKNKPNGPHRYACDVDSRAAVELWLDRILG